MRAPTNLTDYRRASAALEIIRWLDDHSDARLYTGCDKVRLWDADAVAGLTDEQWEQLATAMLRAPFDERVRFLVVDQMRRREAQPDPFVGIGGGAA